MSSFPATTHKPVPFSTDGRLASRPYGWPAGIRRRFGTPIQSDGHGTRELSDAPSGHPQTSLWVPPREANGAVGWRARSAQDQRPRNLQTPRHPRPAAGASPLAGGHGTATADQGQDAPATHGQDGRATANSKTTGETPVLRQKVDPSQGMTHNPSGAMKTGAARLSARQPPDTLHIAQPCREVKQISESGGGNAKCRNDKGLRAKNLETFFGRVNGTGGRRNPHPTLSLGERSIERARADGSSPQKTSRRPIIWRDLRPRVGYGAASAPAPRSRRRSRRAFKPGWLSRKRCMRA